MRPRLLNAAHEISKGLGARPLLALLLPTPYALFGAHPGPHLVLAIALSTFAAWCFYLLLRELSLGPLDAGLVGALALLFPWSDSTRLWATAGITQVAVCLYLIGAVVALRALALEGAKSRALHGAALTLYLLSILTYEVAAGAVLLSGLLYLTRAPLRTALRRWLIDVAVVVPVLVVAALRTSEARHVGSIHRRVAEIPIFAHQSISLFRRTLVPWHAATGAVSALAFILCGVVLVSGLRRVRNPHATAVRRWLLITLAGIIIIAAANFVVLGSGLHPLDEGRGNRANIFAGLGYVLLVYALVSLAVQLVLGRHGSSVIAAPAIVTAIAVALAVGFAERLSHDKARWDRASTMQDHLLSVLDRSPRPPPGSTIYTFNYPAQVAPGVPVFDARYDLDGALKLRRHDRSVSGYPIFTGVGIACERQLMHPTGTEGYGRGSGATYGRGYLIDVLDHRVAVPQNQAECRQATKHFHPGPDLAATY